MDIALQRSARLLGAGGVASIVFGVIVLLWPGISLVALTALFGGFAFVYGAFALGAGLNLLAHRSTNWVPYVVGGVAGVLLGVITFLHPAATDLTLTFLIAAWAFVVGVFEVVMGIDMWGSVDGAIWTIVAGAASILFGILVAIRPGSGLLAILWLVGLYAIVGGISRLVAAYRIHQFQGTAKKFVGAMQREA